MKISSQCGYIQAGSQNLYGRLWQPESGQPDCCLLFAEPFGEEKRCGRMLVRMAESLAGNGGCAVLKFDYSGTGDSSGEHGEASWSRWTGELRTAAEKLQECFPRASLVLAGLRGGALTAAAAAAALPVKKLFLLSPVLSGTELMEELLRRRRMNSLLMGQDGEDAPADDFSGIQIGPGMLAEMPDLDLLEALKRLPEDCGVHLIHCSGAAKFPPDWKNLISFLQERPGSTMTLLRDKPFWGQLEYYESDLLQQKVQEVLHG